MTMFTYVDSTVERCQANCAAGKDRLAGPKNMTGATRHPFAITNFPTKNNAFCQLGCQYFFSDSPTNVTCAAQCEYAYRYRVTAGYSDVIEESLSNCHDGCNIALQTCQAGFYCNDGEMKPCEPGTYRGSLTGMSNVTTCTKCPFGRYRSLAKGKNPDECSLCPRGKYANFQGATATSECIRCPAGKFADEQGMKDCQCITDTSCDLKFTTPAGVLKERFYMPDQDGISVDYHRESVPYIGRW